MFPQIKMIREIKFRAWDKKLKLMIQDIEYHGKYKCNEDEEIFMVMQFTGLKDKNGKEIYEGDILKEDYSDDEGEDWVIILIEMEHFADCGYREIKSKKGNIYDIRLHRPERFEVIGNKFEDPELLKNVERK